MLPTSSRCPPGHVLKPVQDMPAQVSNALQMPLIPWSYLLKADEQTCCMRRRA